MTSHFSVFEQLMKMCLEKPELAREIWDLFFTPEEKEDMNKRYLIVEALLKQKKTQRQIAKDLDVSIAKITRGSNELKRIKADLLDYLHQHLG